MENKKITVLFGGWSTEREISINSGKNVSKMLKKMGYEVFELDVRKNLKSLTEELYKSDPDFIFNLLHGEGGEDGTIQGVLEIFGVPYSNSGVLSSAISFDKRICKEIVKARGVRVADGFEIDWDDIKNINEKDKLKMEYPFVIKPVANGSSIGVFIIFDANDLNKLKNVNWTFGKVMVEKYIEGREFTVLVSNGKVIGAVEISYKSKFFDFESKYIMDGAVHVSNYKISKFALKEMFSMAEIAFNACKCRGYARVDFRYDNNNVYFLEINTQPGMTELSLAPDIARLNGISFEEFLKGSIEGFLKS
ncbi:MAG: D-alanine--D-alanine ligase [Holosporales bacterium]|jgi:D-alanine-D-alanine ligase|nr:D-alanine--D-alanine ligase [Holosporales bacterium]